MEENNGYFFDEVEFREHLYAELIERGFAPTSEEAKVIAQIVTDYLIDLGLEEIK